MVKLNFSGVPGMMGMTDSQPRLITLLRSATKSRIFGHQSRDMTTLEHPGSVQLHSPLLSLPREVRNMIWRHLMGGMIIHLWIDEDYGKKLRGSYCWAEDENCRLRCRAWLQKKGTIKWPTIGVWGFAMCCAQAYTESIPYLYELNAFDTRSPEVVCRLPRLISAPKINAITSFTFCWTLPKPPSLSPVSRRHCHEEKFEEAKRGCNGYQREWIQTWKCLAAMQGLDFLRIEINIVGREAVTGTWEAADFYIMTVVKIPRTLHVVVNDESARRMRSVIKAPNLTIVGILEEEVQLRRKLSGQDD
ncbi:hypothetical protein ONS95_008756 [Cadophora gregata]|uniref:uncharacterized protein n=1 Tax=Cadophora gregata TaxID=51156 RepID=UPI0026DD04BA|nr:uncharacterized protein ONS95_008756 [Cadophora gregata]KAK0123749.1 hypothetical protein ONS95_008756 [Cadophora gregata]